MKGYVKTLLVLVFGGLCFFVSYVLVNRSFNFYACSSDDNGLNKVASFKIIPNIDGSETFFINDIEIDLGDIMASIGDVSVFDDFIIYNVNYIDNYKLFIADFNGHVKSIDSLMGDMYRGEYYVLNNFIYIKSDNLAQDDYIACDIKDNSDVVFVQKMEYLGDFKFSDLVLDSTIKANDYIKENNISCNNLLKNGN